RRRQSRSRQQGDGGHHLLRAQPAMPPLAGGCYDANPKETSTMISRGELLTIGAAGLTAATLPSSVLAQTPKRGGTLTLRTWDPPHFDQILAHAYKTHVVISFTHSRLLRQKTGANVKPGSFAIEGDLAESWQQTSDTTYVFKLRKGGKFHAKPPVNGRELTADDVRYTFERILTDKGSARTRESVRRSRSPSTVRVSSTPPWRGSA